MKDLERLIKKILDDAKKEGAPDRAIIENSLKRFAKIYKTCTNKKEREVEDKGAYKFIQTIFSTDLASQQICVDIYEDCKKKKLKIQDFNTF
ncbi:MAG: hypothetical protein AABW90_00225 [Nanoarchaeota archaeon]